MIYYISVENFLKVLSFRIWKEIERCGDGFYIDNFIELKEEMENINVHRKY